MSSAQNLRFSAIVLDAQNEAIPYATISLKNAKVATTSNLNGRFELVFPKENLNDSLVIRHISFEPKMIHFTQETIDSLETISLKTKSNDLLQVEIRAYTAEQIIEKVIDAIPINYAQGYYYLDGFYRQAHQENHKYVRLIECFATVKEDISNRNSTTQKEQFHISEIRRSNVYERNGDKHGDHLVDLFLEDPINYAHASFLNKQAYRQYDFTFENNGFEDVIKIYFQNKAWTLPENKSGYILINRADYAVVEMEIVSTANPQDISYNKSDWKFQNGTYKVQYEKHDGKYFCKRSSKYYNHYVMNEHTKNVEYVVEEYFDWYQRTFNIMEKVADFPFKSMTNLYSRPYNYKIDTYYKNSNSWDKIPKLDQKIIDDLNSFMDLEKQFLDD